MNQKSPLNHLAIIMDGNTRWSEIANKSLYEAYDIGMLNSKKIIEAAKELNIPHLTLFAFSSENWNRPKHEVEFLLTLLEKYLDQELENILKQNVKLKFIGDMSAIDAKLRSKMENIELVSDKNGGINVNVAFSYNGQEEIVDAVKKILASNINPDNMTKSLMQQYMYNPLMPDVDLVIRTGGDMRISGFLLWYISYAEFYFCDKYWPDFDKKELEMAIEYFKKCKRNFGYARK